MPRSLRLAAVAVLVAALAVAATWAVRYSHVQERSINVAGTVEALQVGVSAKITGRIAELTVREGQAVERGQLLIRLEAEELTAEARRTEAALRSAQAQLRDLEAGARREEIDEAEARAAQAQSRLNDLLAGARPEEVEQARANLRNATATRVWTERDFQRVRDLFGKDLIAAAEVDRARQAYDVAVANETMAQEKLRLTEAGARADEVAAARADVRAARERVQLLRAGPRVNAVEAARAQMVQAEAAHAVAQARLAETRLFSPLTGLVLRKNLEMGETANPGIAILTLMDPRDVWLRAYVAETDIGRLRIGQAADITVDAYPGRRFAGAVTEIASEAEFTPKNVQTKKERVNLVFRVKVAVTNPDGTLKPGMPADAEFH
jgi:HlyD family secretion protein